MGWAQTSPTPADGDVQAVRAGLGALLEEPHLAAYCTDAVVQKCGLLDGVPAFAALPQSACTSA